MAVKVYTRLSETTRQIFRDQCAADPVFSLLTESQQNAFINVAVDKYNKFSNEEDLGEYEFDTIADADIFLSPTISSFSNLYHAYLKIKFGAYDGEDTVINDVDDTKVLIAIDEGNITVDDSDDEYVIYTIPITGATLNRTFKLMPPQPSYADLEYSGNNIVVTVRKNHEAFDVEIEKRKEVLS